jgi:hypothetical protein
VIDGPTRPDAAPATHGWLGVGLVLVVMLACAPESRGIEIGELRLVSGGRVADAVATGTRPEVLLLLDPAACLTCERLIYDWIDLRRRLGDRVMLILSREPSDVERRQLIIARVPVDNIIRDRNAGHFGQATVWTLDSSDRALQGIPIARTAGILKSLTIHGDTGGPLTRPDPHAQEDL